MGSGTPTSRGVIRIYDAREHVISAFTAALTEFTILGTYSKAKGDGMEDINRSLGRGSQPANF